MNNPGCIPGCQITALTKALKGLNKVIFSSSGADKSVVTSLPLVAPGVIKI